MSAPAPGRYCLAVCYCGECDHYKPIVRHADTADMPAPTRVAKPTAWATREDETWIDKL